MGGNTVCHCPLKVKNYQRSTTFMQYMDASVTDKIHIQIYSFV